jgi:hypothetical protein
MKVPLRQFLYSNLERIRDDGSYTSNGIRVLRNSQITPLLYSLHSFDSWVGLYNLNIAYTLILIHLRTINLNVDK